MQLQTLNQNALTVDAPYSTCEKQKNTIRVLHVDDDVCFLDVSKQILTIENNFEIDNVTSVEDAFKKMEHQTYDAVISDYEMSQKNGLDFLKELREQNNQIPFVLFTGKGREDVAIKALNLGADRYINKQGNAETVYGELSDALIKTVEHGQSKKMLVESESKYRKLVENSLQGIAIIQGHPPKFVFANEAMKKLFGYTPEELTILQPEQIMGSVHPDDREAFFDRFKKRIEGKETESVYVFRGFRKDGSLIWVEVCANLIEYDGKPAVQGVFLDITETKKAEESLRENEQRYRELANCLPDIVFEANLDGQLEFANERAAKISGYCIKEIEKGLNILQFIVPEDRKRAEKNIQKLFHGSGYSTDEYTFLRKDCTTFPAIISATRRVFKDKVTGLRGLVLDITERKKAEKELRESELKYRNIFYNSQVGIFRSRLDGSEIIDFNEKYLNIFGLTREEMRGMRSVSLWADPLERKEMVRKLQSHGFVNDFECKMLNKQREIRHCLTSVRLYPEQGILEGLMIDITDRKNAEEALKESEKMSRAIVANSPIGIATSGADKRFLSANEAFCRILGYTEEEIRNLTFTDITHPEDLYASVQKIKELVNGGIPSFTFEKRYVKKDGTVIEGKIMVNAVRNQNGEPTFFVAELEDITERKKTEERRKVLERKVSEYSKHLKYIVDLRTAQLKDANERLVKTERLAAIGELAGMVGHDLRNPLTGIKNAAYYLKKKGTAISETQAREMFEIIDKSIDHSNKIINDLLDYAREMHLELTKYSAHTLVDDATRMIQIPDRIHIVNNVPHEVWIWVDADKMIRVFTNLIKNAIDAMPGEGTLKITSCQNRKHVEIVFADTGTGMPKEMLPKIFSPLFTTKAQGMGFGLAICKRFVDAHEGNITVETSENKGTTFTITLPTKPKRASSGNQNAN